MSHEPERHSFYRPPRTGSVPPPEEAAGRALRTLFSFVARVGCALVGFAGLASGCQPLPPGTGARPDLVSSGVCLLASAVAFGALALASRPAGPLREEEPITGRVPPEEAFLRKPPGRFEDEQES
jgi:hypothetical protein